MSGSRTIVQLLSIAMLLLWSGVLLFFYYTGRISHYLPAGALFQPLVLGTGIGLAILGFFNLFTTGGEDSDPSSTPHSSTCCGGHDKDHDHDHHHAAQEADSHSAQSGGMLDESSWTGRIIALLILAAPLSWAAFKTPDSMSEASIKSKAARSQNYAAANTANAGKFSLRSDAPTPAAKPAAKAPPQSDAAPVAMAKPAPTVASAPPAPTPATTPPPSVASSPPAGTGTGTGASAAAAPGVVTTQALDKTPATPPGAASTQSYGKFTLADLEKQVPRSKDGNFVLEVPEIYYTAGDAEVQSVIAGQSVETTAQVLPEKVNNADGHRLRIFRLLVQCCAADARPYSVPVDFGKKAPEFKDMSWVKVTGKMAFRKEGNQTVPIIESATIEPTAAPDNQMISQ